MKISVICASRGRPISLIGAIKNLDMLESQQHEVAYGIVIDEDDVPSRQAAELLQSDLEREVRIFNAPRDIVARKVNAAAREMEAELYLPYADDCYCLTPNWDVMCERIASKVPAFSWTEFNDPQNVTMLTLTHKWVETVGYVLSEYFPFWMADTWIQEQYAFATAQPIGLVRQLVFSGRRGKTKQLNDVRFWFEFFAAKRSERIEEARKLRKALGFEHVNDDSLKGFIDAFEMRDKSQIENSANYEEWFASGEPKSVAYMEALDFAQRFMENRKLEAA